MEELKIDNDYMGIREQKKILEALKENNGNQLGKCPPPNLILVPEPILFSDKVKKIN